MIKLYSIPGSDKFLKFFTFLTKLADDSKINLVFQFIIDEKFCKFYQKSVNLSGYGINLKLKSSNPIDKRHWLKMKFTNTLLNLIKTKSSSVDDTVTGDLTMQEVAKHATSSDCWVVVFDRVHNLTSFIPRHPGGPSRILVACGKNATDTFLNAGYVHDTIARDTLR